MFDSQPTCCIHPANRNVNDNPDLFTKGQTFNFNRIRNRVPNLGTDSREKGIHFIGSRELNIKRVTRDGSCSVVMNAYATCFNKVIEYTNWCCLSVDIIQ